MYTLSNVLHTRDSYVQKTVVFTHLFVHKSVNLLIRVCGIVITPFPLGTIFGAFLAGTFSGKDFSQERSIRAIYSYIGSHLTQIP